MVIVDKYQRFTVKNFVKLLRKPCYICWFVLIFYQISCFSTRLVTFVAFILCLIRSTNSLVLSNIAHWVRLFHVAGLQLFDVHCVQWTFPSAETIRGIPLHKDRNREWHTKEREKERTNVMCGVVAIWSYLKSKGNTKRLLWARTV